MSSLKSFLHSLRIHPLRGVLILLTVTVGVATLTVTTSLSMDVRAALDSSLMSHGRRVVIANGELNDAGQLTMQQPPRFNVGVMSILSSDYENLSDLGVVAKAWTDSFILIGDKNYVVRSVIQTSETYADLMNLEMAAGRFFDQDDVESQRKVIVVSALTAQMLFGSSEAAVGESVGVRSRAGTDPFTIVGVFDNVSELEREAYGIGDMIFSATSTMPGGLGVNLTSLLLENGGVLVARIASDSIEKAESRIRAILAPAYGDDLLLSVWEGSAEGPAPLIEESRRSVSNFALAVSILGFIILATSSIGIFSVMLVEVLGRTRDIGLRRALGTTRAGIRQFFIGQALYYSLFGSIVGSGVALLLYRAIGMFLTPLFNSAGFRASDITLATPGLVPVAIAVGSALVFGGLFGFFPAISAARMPIAECIREDAA
jgi:putative ABC transport system permease protein